MAVYTLEHVYPDRSFKLGDFRTYNEAHVKAVWHWQLFMHSPSGGCQARYPYGKRGRVKELHYERFRKDFYRITYHPTRKIKEDNPQ